MHLKSTSISQAVGFSSSAFNMATFHLPFPTSLTPLVSLCSANRLPRCSRSWLHLGGYLSQGLYLAVVGVPILGPYLVTESTDIPCLGFICEGLDSGGRHQQVPLAGGFLAEGGVPFSSAAS